MGPAPAFLTVVLEATPFALTWTPGDGLRGLHNPPAPWEVARDRSVLVLTGHGVPSHDLPALVSTISASSLCITLTAAGPHTSPAPPPEPELFNTLYLSRLRSLTLASSHAPAPDTFTFLAAFLRLSSSRGLERLALDPGPLTAGEVQVLADTVERHNASLSQLCVAACGKCLCRNGWGDGAVRAESRRLGAALRRNERLRARVGKAAIRALVLACVLFHARDDRRGVVKAMASMWGSRVGPARPAGPAFPVLRLPRVVLARVVRLATGDPGALAPDQWERVFELAADRDALRRVGKVFAGARTNEVIAEWLAEGGFFWDRAIPPPARGDARRVS
ncbi:hypothetical protein Q8F55_005419 [Vanrija albida]|uniref:Uncharacterized protein n=1 Tax=Vanrija albida TaxID=181172 RepID=A0ABR3Q1S7_9TREE